MLLLAPYYKIDCVYITEDDIDDAPEIQNLNFSSTTSTPSKVQNSNLPSTSTRPVSDNIRADNKEENTLLTKAKWKISIRKKRRNAGQEYISLSGKVVPSKGFVNSPCSCKQNCNDKMGADQRRSIFDSFWKLSDYSCQNVFRGLVKANKVKRKRVRDGSHPVKQTSFEYNLRVDNTTIKVCKKFFAETLVISAGRLYRCLSKDEIFSVTDSRGMNPKKKIDDSQVIEHINSFPAYQSHYTRKDNPKRKYLNENLKISKMYEMYTEKCIAEGTEPLKRKFYYNVFHTKFNLSFKPPSKDTCTRCDELEMKIKVEQDGDKKNSLINEKQRHLSKANMARASLKQDQESASDSVYVATFDLQKALPFPKLTESIAYYKKNIYVLQFGHSFF